MVQWLRALHRSRSRWILGPIHGSQLFEGLLASAAFGFAELGRVTVPAFSVAMRSQSAFRTRSY